METLSNAWLTLVLLSTTCWRKMSSGIGQQSVRRVLQRSKRPWHQQRYLPIPTPMFHLVLHVHSAHAGVVRMKSLARRHVWWPHIDQDIEKWAKECQFTAEEFNKFCLGNGIKHTLTAPYHPSTNGEAERFVQTFKTSIQKHKGALQKNLCNFLLHYQSTPNTTTGKLQLRSCLVETSRPECSLASTFKRKTLSTRQVKEWSILWEKCLWTGGQRSCLDAKNFTNMDSRFHHHKVWPTELPSPCKWKIPQEAYWPTTNSFFGYFGRYQSQVSRFPKWAKWPTRKPANTTSPIKTVSSTGEPKTSGQTHLLTCQPTCPQQTSHYGKKKNNIVTSVS